MRKQIFLFLYILILMISLNGSSLFAGVGTLSWDPPATNTDGSPLTDLEGYKVYYGTSSGNYSQGIDVGNVTTYTVSNLNDGTYYFAVTAHDTSGNESDYSNEVSKTIQSVQQYTLTINKGGTGSGTVTSSPAGINCDSDCSETYNQGTVITLTATPAINSIFTGWSGGGCSGTGTCSISLNADTLVTATFTLKTYTITATAGTGGSISPSGSVTVNHGANQTFTITPNTNYSIANVLVDGNSVGAASSYTFTNVTASHAISASFAINTYSLTVSKNGTGTGTVTSSPAGINCGSDCSETYNAGTTVTLTASADMSSTFTGWSGACTGTGACTVTMDAAKSVTATFTLKTYTITATAGTGGSISPSGSVTVNHGANQTFTITPDATYSVSNVLVDGSSIGSVSTYTFTNVTGDHSISASFKTFDTDNDGVSDTEEYGPQSDNPDYDGNNDGIPDYLQNSVASLYTFDNLNYITIFSPDGKALKNVSPGQVPQGAPSGANFPYYFLNFGIDLEAGTGTNIIIKLPEGALINKYYKYGPTNDNATPHWYEFMYDGQTGAEISSNSVTTLYLVDGFRGDDDLLVNGQVIDQGGPAITPDIAVAPSSYNFGEVIIGSTSPTQTFMISNGGIANLNIDIVTIEGADSGSFAIQDNTCSSRSIAPAGTCTIDVIFSPLSEGNKNAMLRIPSNDPETPDLYLSLSGTGKVQKYMLSINKAGNGTVTSNPAGINCGSSCSSLFDKGTIITLTAISGIDSAFTGWSGGGCSGNGTCSISLNADTLVTAAFTLKTYTITATAGTGGSISPSGSVTVNHGANQTFTITSSTAHSIADVIVDGRSVGIVSSYTFNKVNRNHIITASFTTNGITLSVIKGGPGSGTVTSEPIGINCGNDCSESYTSGTLVKLTAIPATGSTFGGWSGACNISGGISANWRIQHNICTVIMNTAKTVKATFTCKTNKITAAAGSGGNISPSGSILVNFGATQTFVVTPNSGYVIANVKVDGALVGAVPAYTFSNVTVNHTIEATFINSNTFPDISVYPTSYDFGNLRVMWSKYATIKITNLGRTNLIIERMDIIGSDASMFSSYSYGINMHQEIIIRPSSTYYHWVSFRPKSAGLKNAVLRIISNDPDTPILDIPLRGIGVEK
ncbi:MAG: choice-of-anchor D domain-containing protein [Nitrospirota bacterium]